MWVSGCSHEQRAAKRIGFAGVNGRFDGVNVIGELRMVGAHVDAAGLAHRLDNQPGARVQIRGIARGLVDRFHACTAFAKLGASPA